MELISVIVPVYNVEPYLDRCVESIVNQTYRNLEILLVDDGSPDRCPEMCDAWAEKDSRIKVIHKENGGLSDARNVGMAAASGELIGFVDSDDWIAPEMYQRLYAALITTGSDIAACGAEMVYGDDTPSRKLTAEGEFILSNEEAMQAIIEEKQLKQPVWYKLYKTNLIQGILFPVGKYHEDVFWSYRVVGKARKIAVFDTPCYFYLQRNESIMGENYSLKRLDGLEAKQQRFAYIKSNYPALEDIARTDLLSSCMYAMQMSLRYLPEKDMERAYHQIYGIWRKAKGKICCSFKQKVWYWMANMSFSGTCRLRNILKIGL